MPILNPSDEPSFVVALRNVNSNLGAVQRGISEFLQLYEMHLHREKESQPVAGTFDPKKIDPAFAESIGGFQSEAVQKVPQDTTLRDAEWIRNALKKSTPEQYGVSPTVAAAPLFDEITMPPPLAEFNKAIPKPEFDPNALPNSYGARFHTPMFSLNNRVTRGNNLISENTEYSPTEISEYLTSAETIFSWVGHAAFLTRSRDGVVLIFDPKYDNSARRVASLCYIANYVDKNSENAQGNMYNNVLAFFTAVALNGGVFNDKWLSSPNIAAAASEINKLLNSAKPDLAGEMRYLLTNEDGWLSDLVKLSFKHPYSESLMNFTLTPDNETNLNYLANFVNSHHLIYVFSRMHVKLLLNSPDFNRGGIVRRKLAALVASFEKTASTNYNKEIFEEIVVPEQGTVYLATRESKYQRLYESARTFTELASRIHLVFKDSQVSKKIEKTVIDLLLQQITLSINERPNNIYRETRTQLETVRYVSEELYDDITTFLNQNSAMLDVPLNVPHIGAFIMRNFIEPKEVVNILSKVHRGSFQDQNQIAFILEVLASIDEQSTQYRELMQINDDIPLPDEAPIDPPTPEPEVQPVLIPQLTAGSVVFPDLNLNAPVLPGDPATDLVKKALDTVSDYFDTEQGRPIRQELESRIVQAKESAIVSRGGSVVRVEGDKVEVTADSISINVNPTYAAGFIDLTTVELLRDLADTFAGDICTQYTGKLRVSSTTSARTAKRYKQDLLQHTTQLRESEWPEGFYTDSNTGDLQFLLRVTDDVNAVILFNKEAEQARVLRFDRTPNTRSNDEIAQLIGTVFEVYK